MMGSRRSQLSMPSIPKRGKVQPNGKGVEEGGRQRGTTEGCPHQIHPSVAGMRTLMLMMAMGFPKRRQKEGQQRRVGRMVLGAR